MLLLLGVVDFALVTQQAMVVSEAAYAGAHYGDFQGASPNTTMMQTVATRFGRRHRGLQPRSLRNGAPAHLAVPP